MYKFGNTITTTGDLNLDPFNNQINFTDDVNITGNLDITGDIIMVVMLLLVMKQQIQSTSQQV